MKFVVWFSCIRAIDGISAASVRFMQLHSAAADWCGSRHGCIGTVRYLKGITRLTYKKIQSRTAAFELVSRGCKQNCLHLVLMRLFHHSLPIHSLS